MLSSNEENPVWDSEKELVIKVQSPSSFNFNSIPNIGDPLEDQIWIKFHQDDKLIGFGWIETHDDRKGQISLAVEESMKGNNFATCMITSLERKCESLNLEPYGIIQPENPFRESILKIMLECKFLINGVSSERQVTHARTLWNNFITVILNKI